MRDCIGNGPGSMLLLGGGARLMVSAVCGETWICSFKIRYYWGGGRRPIQIIGGAVRPPPTSGAYRRIGHMTRIYEGPARLSSVKIHVHDCSIIGGNNRYF